MKNINMFQIENYLFYILGIFLCLNCLKIFGISISFFPVFIIIFLSVINLFYEKRKTYSKIIILFFYYINIFISIIVGMYYGIENFKSNFFTFEFIKVILFLMILFLVKFNNKKYIYFIKGLKIGIIINLIWATLELILWWTLDFSWNTYIFEKILDYKINHSWINTKLIFNREFLRVCGFSWDPSFLGMLSALGVLILNNRFWRYYSFFILLNTYSRSGQVAFIFSIFALKIFDLLKNINYKNFIKNIFKISLPCILGVFFIFYFINTTQNSHYGDTRRRQYYFSAMESTIVNKKISLFLWGGSPFKTGNILYLNKKIKEKSFLEKKMIINWKIESDWAGILAGRGWLGFLYYIFLHLYIIIKAKDKELRKLTSIFLFAGIGYTYENSLIINLVMIYFYTHVNEKRLIYERNNTCRRKWNKTLSCYKSNIKTNNTNI